MNLTGFHEPQEQFAIRALEDSGPDMPPRQAVGGGGDLRAVIAPLDIIVTGNISTQWQRPADALNGNVAVASARTSGGRVCGATRRGMCW